MHLKIKVYKIYFYVMKFAAALRSFRRGQPFDWSEVSVDGESIESVLENYQHFKYDQLIDKILADAEIEPVTLSNTDSDFIITRETVRPIDNISTFKCRITGAKKMYGWFHKELPLKPLIFCSVMTQPTKSLDGFMKRLQKNIPNIDADDTAVFYSVNSPWNIGRAGEFLKKVMDLYYSNVKNVITFSPIPNLSKSISGPCDRETVRQHLMKDCPVYKFHIQNGAQLSCILMDADTSPKGMSKSYGWQASYEYRSE